MSNRDRLRRTMMFLPGNSPSMIRDSIIYKPDSIMIDLEDAVSINEKDSARLLAFNAIKSIDFRNIEVVVRINSLDSGFGKDDIFAMVAAGADVIRLPKTEVAQDIVDVEKLVIEAEKKYSTNKNTLLMAAVESAKGVLNSKEIALSSERLMGIAIGAEDYVTDLKTRRSEHGMELFLARSMIVLAARNAGIYCFDTVNSNLKDMDQFRNEVKFIKDLGFDGKSIIHPKQIDIVHEIYSPTYEEYIEALRIIDAARESEEKGSGVTTVNGKMIDKPIIIRAKRTVELAEASGMSLGEYDE